MDEGSGYCGSGGGIESMSDNYFCDASQGYIATNDKQLTSY